MASRKQHFSETFRIFHRYLGFFLAGIMAVYAISGIVLTFRNTDMMKVEEKVTVELQKGLEGEALGRELRIRNFKVDRQEGATLYFEQGSYNSETGVADYTKMKYPWLLDKMNKLHLMHSGNPLFWLAIFFAISLLFFSFSAFFMFRFSAPVYKKGLYFAVAGFTLAVVLVLV